MELIVSPELRRKLQPAAPSTVGAAVGEPQDAAVGEPQDAAVGEPLPALPVEILVIMIELQPQLAPGCRAVSRAIKAVCDRVAAQAVPRYIWLIPQVQVPATLKNSYNDIIGQIDRLILVDSYTHRTTNSTVVVDRDSISVQLGRYNIIAGEYLGHLMIVETALSRDTTYWYTADYVFTCSSGLERKYWSYRLASPQVSPSHPKISIDYKYHGASAVDALLRVLRHQPWGWPTLPEIVTLAGDQ